MSGETGVIYIMAHGCHMHKSTCYTLYIIIM